MAKLLRRLLSNIPETTVYSGPKPPSPRITLNHLRNKHRRGEPITMVTAYDYPAALQVDLAGIDVLLVGDSAAMVVHGHDTTLPISLDQMLSHCRAVARGASRPLLVGDLPFGSYESSPSQAVDTAVRVLKEGAMDAIKLEGGAPSRITAARAIVEAGIAVMGHVGLTPQATSVLGGFRPQGKTVESAVKVVERALALQEAGCFSVVLECVPAPVAAAATAALKIPTIGIGAGPFCSGQKLKTWMKDRQDLAPSSPAQCSSRPCSASTSCSSSLPTAVVGKEAFFAIEAYLITSCTQPANKLTAVVGKDAINLLLIIGDNEEVDHTFLGEQLWWTSNEFNPKSQVLVYHDLLGMFQHPHHAKVAPKFCKQYGNVGEAIHKALSEYKEEVEKKSFPGAVHTPYPISASDFDGFVNELQKMGLDEAASAASSAAENAELAGRPSEAKTPLD